MAGKTSIHVVSDVLCDAVQNLLDECVEYVSSQDETFVLCKICGEADSHHDSCFVPALKKWQADA